MFTKVSYIRIECDVLREDDNERFLYVDIIGSVNLGPMAFLMNICYEKVVEKKRIL